MATVDSQEIAVDGSRGAVFEALKLLRHRTNAEIVLDFAPLAQGSSQARRPDLMALAMLGNALLGSSRGRGVTVRLVPDSNVVRQLARSGFLFALAQRPGQTRLDLLPDNEKLFTDAPAAVDLARWRRSWTPDDNEFRHSVLSATNGDDSSALVQRGFIVFKNPHLAVERGRLTTEVNGNLVSHWTPRILRELGMAEAEVTTLAASVNATVAELVLNFAIHAFGTIPSAPPTRRDVPRDRQVGYVALYTTEGGGERSGNRLHVVVADAGHGIAATLRPKLPNSHPLRAGGSDVDVLRALLVAELPAYGRGEGRGLLRLIELADSNGGTLHISTSATDGTYGTVIAEHDGRLGDTKVEGRAELDIPGTIVRMSFRLDERPSVEE